MIKRIVLRPVDVIKHFKYYCARISTQHSKMSRFDLYVKAGKDGKSIGDCPFSQRVNLFIHFKLPKASYQIKTVNVGEKTPEFLALNPEGKVPVLVDKEKNNKVITDSRDINVYVDGFFPEPDMKINYDGPANAATGSIFGKLAALLKNTDRSAIPELQECLSAELQKFEDYLKSREKQTKFLIDDSIMEIDCQLLPKLRHVQVAGQYFQGYEISSDLVNVWSYIREGEATHAWQATSCKDEDIIAGWSRHNIIKID